jgi:prepilin-type N-terminal cleavage/methylation domain-containing protein
MYRNQKGFTLMELMVVIVIVTILAAVAVPLYINYVKDAQRTEAKAAIGAIATAEQTYFLKLQSKNPGTAAQYGTLEDLKGHTTTLGEELLNISDAETKWSFAVTGSTTGYTVTATYNGSNPAIVVYYTYTQGQGGTFSDQAPSSGSGG